MSGKKWAFWVIYAPGINEPPRYVLAKDAREAAQEVRANCRIIRDGYQWLGWGSGDVGMGHKMSPAAIKEAQETIRRFIQFVPEDMLRECEEVVRLAEETRGITPTMRGE